MSIGQTVLLAIIEGFSEFLPISSTGHLILASSAMGIAQQEFTKMFTVCIQFGAILSVVVLYWRRFAAPSASFYLKLLIAFLPAAVIGKLFGHKIDLLLDNVMVVAVSLLLGGIVFLFVDQIFRRFFQEDKTRFETPSHQSAFWIGCFQTIALIPGVSRSAATIIGGLSQKLTRRAAAEFSFLLAVPTMFAATCYKLGGYYKQGNGFSEHDVKILLIGNLVAFGVALLTIKALITYLSRHGFKAFGYYRILLGFTLIVWHLF